MVLNGIIQLLTVVEGNIDFVSFRGRDTIISGSKASKPLRGLK